MHTSVGRSILPINHMCLLNSKMSKPESHLLSPKRINQQSGFSLIGVLILIITLAVLTSVALEAITPYLEESRRIETEAALHAVGRAVAGDYALGGMMSGADFGYVGDVGALPTSLSSLQTNPGGYTTWNGPYIHDDFLEATNKAVTDSWGTSFNYTGGVTVTSSGSGNTINYTVAKTTTDLLNCGFTGIIKGANGVTPGISSGNVISVVSYPNGAGAMKSDTASVSSSGVFNFSAGLPIGIRSLLVKDTITSDSANSFVRLLPRSTIANTNAGTLRLPTTNY